jgi:hypothetical protein
MIGVITTAPGRQKPYPAKIWLNVKAGRPMPDPQAPAKFTIEINKRVAALPGLRHPGKCTLREQIKRLEHQQ